MREVRAPESRYGGRENEAEEGAGRWGGRSANENSKKGGDFEKPPSFCIMSVNRMLFLGDEGLKS